MFFANTLITPITNDELSKKCLHKIRCYNAHLGVIVALLCRYVSSDTNK